MWDVFMDQFEVLATKAPVMLVAGNHERDFPLSGDRFNTASDSGELLGAQCSWAVMLNDIAWAMASVQAVVFHCLVIWHTLCTSLIAGRC